MTTANEAIKIEILEASQSGRLLEAIFDHSNFGEESAVFCTACVELHNDGKIDLLSVTSSPAFAALTATQFFAGQHVFCQAIPKLKAPIIDVMHCVLALVGKGGQDLAASQPNGAFKAWCVDDLDRAREVIRASHDNDPLSKNFLTFALEAIQTIEEAKRFVAEYSDERRVFGITALGRMVYSDDESAEGALTALATAIADTNDDALIANILIAAFGIKEKRPDLGYADLAPIAKHACANPGPAVHSASARILSLYGKSVTPEILGILFGGLMSLDVSHKGTVETLDIGLSQLLNGPFAEQSVKFLAELLTSKHGTLKLDEFHAFGSALIGQEILFHKTLVSWLLSAEPSLCEGLEALLRTHRQSEKPLNLPIAEMKLSSVHKIFLCRKAAGYFFLQPIVAASILVSVLRSCDSDLKEPVGNLLFDPLLHNYGGKIRGYLGTINSDDPASQSVQLVLKQTDDYIEGIKSVGVIKELHPSESQRQTVRMRDADDMRKAHNEAMKQSVLLSLVTRSVILHGRRTLTTVVDPGNKRRFLEMEMAAHSVEFELPRMEITDPVGLDYTLRVLRSERFRT